METNCRILYFFESAALVFSENTSTYYIWEQVKNNAHNSSWHLMLLSRSSFLSSSLVMYSFIQQLFSIMSILVGSFQYGARHWWNELQFPQKINATGLESTSPNELPNINGLNLQRAALAWRNKPKFWKFIYLLFNNNLIREGANKSPNAKKRLCKWLNLID